MADQNYRFPGGHSFVRSLGKIHGDANLPGLVSRLGPVQAALAYVQNAAHATTPEARNELLKRAAQEARTLQAGIASIQDAIKEVTDNYDAADPTDGKGVMGALPRPQPQQRGGRTRPAYETINSAPIDAGELGATGSARPPGYGEAPPPGDPFGPDAGAADQPPDYMKENEEFVKTAGVDEGQSGGPPRPDTGVNQSFNQVNMPTSHEQAPMSAETYKQDRNPPHDEPNESDDGTGLMINQGGPDQGSGVTQAALAAERGESPRVDDAYTPPHEAQEATQQAQDKAQAAGIEQSTQPTREAHMRQIRAVASRKGK